MAFRNALVLIGLFLNTGIAVQPALAQDQAMSRAQVNNPGYLSNDEYQSFINDLSDATAAGLSMYVSGNAVAALAACGSDVGATAMTAVFDTVPFLGLGAAIFQEATSGEFDAYIRQAYERRGVKDDSSQFLSLLIGAPVALLTSSVFETISNGAKMVMFRHPAGVDYSATALITKSSYVMTESQFMKSFENKSSICRTDLWKIYRIAREMYDRAKPAAPNTLVMLDSKVIFDTSSQSKKVSASEDAAPAQGNPAAGTLSAR